MTPLQQIRRRDRYIVGTDLFIVYVTVRDADGNEVDVECRQRCPW